jgi:hypothetical protein
MTLLLGSMITLWTGCEKEPSSSIPTPTITLDKGTYSQLEVALLSSTGITIQENLYNGTISNEAVILVKVQGSLAFIVPEVSAGAHKLKVTISGQDLEVTINVSAAVIVSNPITYVDTKMVNLTYTTVELDSLILISTGMLGSSDDVQNKAIIETYFNDYQTKFAALTTSEKQQAANFVRVNESLFVPLDDVLGILDTTNLHRFGNVFTQKLEHSVQNITVSKLK